MSSTFTLSHPTLKTLFGGALEIWLNEASSLPNFRLWLSELELAFAILLAKCGENAIKPYANRLWAAVKQSVSGKNENELEALSFEILCLGKLASVADEIVLLEASAPKGRPTPEAKMNLAGRECVVECRAPFPGVSRDEWFGSASLETMLNRLKHSIGAEDLPQKFAPFKWRVNLVFVSYLATLPTVGVTLVPLLYGSEYLVPTPFNPFERDGFVVPLAEELGSDSLFAREDWQCISGVAWVSYHPTPLDNPQTIHFEGFVFPNPKALRRIPLEVAVKLHEAMNLHTLTCDAADRREAAEWLVPRLVKQLTEKWKVKKVKVWGSFKDSVFWHRRSDIDIVVDGLDWKQLIEAEEELAKSSPFAIPIQLSDWESLPEKWRQQLERGEDFMGDWKEKVRQEMESIGEIVERRFPEWRSRGDPAQDTLVRAGLGLILHDFYNGVERIFSHILASLSEKAPAGEDWHRKLLEQVSEPAKNRPSVISSDLHEMLNEYLRFRHLFRHIYAATDLKWERMHSLVERLPRVYEQFKREVEEFLNKLSEEGNLTSRRQ